MASPAETPRTELVGDRAPPAPDVRATSADAGDAGDAVAAGGGGCGKVHLGEGEAGGEWGGDGTRLVRDEVSAVL